ncbi:MAG: hypothetical protein P8Q97_18380 [Myxococcota bacterium]|jgi:hypothetical protein|nr:hypothetical protein [Myxococcota bacterium]
MKLQKPPPEIARMGLRGMKMVVNADGEFHSLERGLMNAVQKNILGTEFDLDDLEDITPRELAEGLPEVFQEQFFNGCLIAALIDGEASISEGALLDEYSSEFGIKSPELKNFHRAIDHHLLLFRFDVARRSFLGQRLKKRVQEEGIRGITSLVRGLVKSHEPKLADRYRSLESRAEGTLGRSYFEFVRNNQFSLPGEVGGPPEPIVFHDCLHVLAEYETSPLEETQIASFQAGLLREQPMFGLFFMLAQFQLGIQVTPITGAESNQVDPELMIKALVRGTHVNRDLTTNWDPWDDFDEPIVDLRHKYNILPR